jgi:hypothetical protein
MDCRDPEAMDGNLRLWHNRSWVHETRFCADFHIPVFWIPATSMDGGSAEDDMESSLSIHAGMTAIKHV